MNRLTNAPMTEKIVLFITLMAYAVIVSQAFMYILALKNAQLGLDAAPYIQLRKLIDFNMRNNLKYVVYTTLLSSLALVLITMREPKSLLFITSLIAFLAMVTDTVLTLKGNMPINNIINTWTAENFPPDWSDYRDRWLHIYSYRQIATITGFVSLVVGVIFKK